MPGCSIAHRLLPPQAPCNRGKPTLVLDLDETLIHSTFNPPDPENLDYDHKIVVQTDARAYDVFCKERPHVREFLQKAFEKWELVLFTASIAAYADAACNKLDPEGLLFWRLFRDSCVGVGQTYTKAPSPGGTVASPHPLMPLQDMAVIGREAQKTVILDNAPVCYLFCPEQGLPIESWYDDPEAVTPSPSTHPTHTHTHTSLKLLP